MAAVRVEEGRSTRAKIRVEGGDDGVAGSRVWGAFAMRPTLEAQVSAPGQGRLPWTGPRTHSVTLSNGAPGLPLPPVWELLARASRLWNMRLMRVQGSPALSFITLLAPRRTALILYHRLELRPHHDLFVNLSLGHRHPSLCCPTLLRPRACMIRPK